MAMLLSATVASELTTCPICLDTFDDPRSLPCIHSFCLKCIDLHCRRKLPGNEVPCPVCRKEFRIPRYGLSGLEHNFFVQRLVDVKKIPSSEEKLGATLCEVCVKENKGTACRKIPAATSWCVNCNQKLCEECSKFHSRTGGASHQLREPGPHSKLDKESLGKSCCGKHPVKRSEFYCIQCNENICLLCSTDKHNNHRKTDIAKVSVDFRSQFGSEHQQILTRMEELRQKSTEADGARRMLIAEMDEITAEIKTAAEQVKKIVDFQVKDLLQQVETVKAEHIRSLEAVNDKLQVDLLATESFCSYLQELLSKGRPHSIASAANELHARAGELLQSELDSASSLPSRLVTFTPADLTQLKKNCFVGHLQMTERVIEQKGDELKRKEEPKAQQPVSEWKPQQNATVLHTLEMGKAIWGLALLDNLLYVLCDKPPNQVEVYDTMDTRTLRHSITIPRLRYPNDLASCQRYRCLYVSDNSKVVHRVDLSGDKPNMTLWQVKDIPGGLSVNAAHNLLITCHEVRKIAEFSSRGDFICDILLSGEIINPLHAVQLASGQLIVCHGEVNDRVHRVCMISADGRQIVHSHGGQKGSGSGQCNVNVPAYLAVDGKNRFIFVADVNNKQVVLLSSTLVYLGQVVGGDQLKWGPRRLCLDAEGRRLYVAEVGESKHGYHTAGRVLVFTI